MTDAAAKHAPSKALYGGLMAGVCVVGCAAAAGVASGLGGDSRTMILASAAVAIGSITTFLPILFGRTTAGVSSFGVLVLVASTSRMLLVLAAGLLFTQTSAVSERPYWIGVATGAGLILIVESALAIALLSRIERRKASHHPAAPAGIP